MTGLVEDAFTFLIGTFLLPPRKTYQRVLWGGRNVIMVGVGAGCFTWNGPGYIAAVLMVIVAFTLAYILLGRPTGKADTQLR